MVTSLQCIYYIVFDNFSLAAFIFMSICPKQFGLKEITDFKKMIGRLIVIKKLKEVILGKP